MGASELAVHESQLIPKVDLTGLENALGEIETQSSRLPALKKVTEAITVTDASRFAEAGNIRQQARQILKSAEESLSPYKRVVKQAADFLNGNLSVLKAEVAIIDGELTRKMAEYSNREREAAEAEQAKLNKGLPKDQSVEVKPMIPTVAGSRKRTVYGAVLEDEDKLLRAYERATGAKKKYLRQFICANFSALEDESAATSGKAEVPGVRFTVEHRV